METILCSAIWFKEIERPRHRPINTPGGVVLCGYRHGDVIGQLVSTTGKKMSNVGENVQGFLTSKNRFVDRVEGAKIALESKQIDKLRFGSFLYSEDLY